MTSSSFGGKNPKNPKNPLYIGEISGAGESFPKHGFPALTLARHLMMALSEGSENEVLEAYHKISLFYSVNISHAFLRSHSTSNSSSILNQPPTHHHNKFSNLSNPNNPLSNSSTQLLASLGNNPNNPNSPNDIAALAILNNNHNSLSNINKPQRLVQAEPDTDSDDASVCDAFSNSQLKSHDQVHMKHVTQLDHMNSNCTESTDNVIHQDPTIPILSSLYIPIKSSRTAGNSDPSTENSNQNHHRSKSIKKAGIKTHMKKRKNRKESYDIKEGSSAVSVTLIERCRGYPSATFPRWKKIKL